MKEVKAKFGIAPIIDILLSTPLAIKPLVITTSEETLKQIVNYIKGNRIHSNTIEIDPRLPIGVVDFVYSPEFQEYNTRLIYES